MLSVTLMLVALTLSFMAGHTLARLVMVITIQKHFLIQGMNWDAVDRHTELVLWRAPRIWGLPKVLREEKSSREKWDAYKAKNLDWAKSREDS